MSRKKPGETPPTTPVGQSRETGQPRDQAVTTVKVNPKLIPKLNRTGLMENKKIISIGARIATRRLTEEAAQGELKELLDNVKLVDLTATASELVDFAARASLAYRRLAMNLIPAARNSLQK